MRTPQTVLTQSRFKRKTLSRMISRATLTGSFAGMLALTAGQAHALSYELENGITVDLDTTVGYNAQWRGENRDPNIESFGGLGFLTDDGNRNFDKGDMTQNQVNFSSDLDINYGDGGVFARARGWYDRAYSGDFYGYTFDNRFDAPYLQDGIDEHKSKIELQDLFWYHGFDLGDQYLSLRVGEQVVNWGESLFIQGGISTAMGPLDATKSNAPGTALKDIFMPIGQVYGELAVTDLFSIGAYYQYDWEATRIDAPGTYFNVLDGVGQKSPGDPFGPFGTPIERDEPDKGQYGIALRYLAENLNSTEFGFYYINYNDFTPALQFLSPASPTGLTQQHFEDIDLYGISFGTVFGDMNVSGEISYRDGVPVSVNYGPNGGPGPGFSFARGEAIQTQLSGIYIFPQNPLADTLTFTGEIAYNRILDVDYPGGVDSLKKDRGAASTVLSLKASYLNLIGGLDMDVTGTYRNDFNGWSSMEFSFAEGVEQFGLKTDFTYLGSHKFGASYVWYLTDTDQVLKERGALNFGHLNADRDYFAAYYKYTF
ncbi:DUF1302 domain-containing protein [Marinobacterium mangrovicola]|uniref:Uncharacterized protein DUF1302 n=1 Tax=Marinobacterium mangrovicola TaxID=1476959 RepID=A0A4V2PEH6_9GAMM|nr:DUF1302 family protein [Marinobacterium mangrovicola]TCK09106.1 uncharacterized protein DUF1302 [Marinobacterium mangrovicola]